MGFLVLKVPSEVKATIDGSFIRYDDLVAALNTKKKLDFTLKSVFWYILFLIFMYTFASAFDHTADRFQYGQSLERVFYHQPFKVPCAPNAFHGCSGSGDIDDNHRELSFANITREEEFWQWFWQVLEPQVLDNPTKSLLNAHKLLWGSRLRVARVPPNSGCFIPSIITEKLPGVKECFYKGVYTGCLATGLSPETPPAEYAPLGCDPDDIVCGFWSMRNYTEGSSFPIRGWYDAYPSGGYIQDFNLNGTQQLPQTCGSNANDTLPRPTYKSVPTKTMGSYLNPFFLHHTGHKNSTGLTNSEAHVVITEVYTYLGSLNLFGRARMIVEISAGGSFKPSMQVQSAVLIPEKTTGEMIGVIMALMLAVSCVYYIASNEWKDPACSSRMLLVFDLVTFLAVLVTVVLIALNFFSDATPAAIQASLNGGMDVYPAEFGSALDWQDIIYVLRVISTLTATLRILRFAPLLRATDMIVSCVVHALSSMGCFIFVCCLLFFAFGFVATSLFGRQEYAYSTAARGALTQLEVVTGSFDRSIDGRHFPEITLCYYILHYFVFSFILINFALAFFVEAWLLQISKNKGISAVKTREFKIVTRYNRNKLFYSIKTILTPRFLARRWGEDFVLSRLKKWKGEKYDPSEAKYLQLKTLRDEIMSDHKDAPGIAKGGMQRTLDFEPLELYLLNSDCLISHLEKERLVELEEAGGEIGDDIAMETGGDQHSNVHETELNELQKAMQELKGLQEEQLFKFEEAVKDLGEKHQGMLDHLDVFADRLKRFDPPKFDKKDQ